jgi:hypothetical protein
VARAWAWGCGRTWPRGPGPRGRPGATSAWRAASPSAAAGARFLTPGCRDRRSRRRATTRSGLPTGGRPPIAARHAVSVASASGSADTGNQARRGPRDDRPRTRRRGGSPGGGRPAAATTPGVGRGAHAAQIRAYAGRPRAIEGDRAARHGHHRDRPPAAGARWRGSLEGPLCALAARQRADSSSGATTTAASPGAVADRRATPARWQLAGHEPRRTRSVERASHAVIQEAGCAAASRTGGGNHGEEPAVSGGEPGTDELAPMHILPRLLSALAPPPRCWRPAAAAAMTTASHRHPG